MKRLFLFLISMCAFVGCESLDGVNDSIDSGTEETITYKVSFNTDGGSYLAPVSVVSGSPVDRPIAPTLTGYTFGDWYNSDRLLTLWDFNTPIVEDITLYAKWYEKPTITFESNGGSAVTSQTVEYNTSATSVTPTKTGYNFDGWYSDSELTTAYDFDTAVVVDITLYAKWVETSSGELTELSHNDAW